jgi:hypothetical protein
MIPGLNVYKVSEWFVSGQYSFLVEAIDAVVEFFSVVFSVFANTMRASLASPRQRSRYGWKADGVTMFFSGLRFSREREQTRAVVNECPQIFGR